MLVALITWMIVSLHPMAVTEIGKIDARIEELKEKKRGFEARALRAENQAERMQFEDRYVLETRQYYRIAEENRLKAELIQEEINRLEKQREELLGGK